MTIYEINSEIMGCFNPETGELEDEERYAALNLEKDSKIENIALWIKDLEADADSIRAEEKSLAERRRVLENKAESLRRFLGYAVGEGNRFQTARCAVSWRKSESVKVNYELLRMDSLCDNYLKYKDPEADKAAIKAAIKDGIPVMGCELVQSNNMQLK